MPGTTIRTNLELDRALDSVARAGKRQGFTVHEIEDDELRLQMGNLPLSIFLGAFICYCNFTVVVEETRKGEVEIRLERNNPWWTGWIGIMRTKSAAKSLVDKILDAVEDAGGEILRKKDY